MSIIPGKGLSQYRGSTVENILLHVAMVKYHYESVVKPSLDMSVMKRACNTRIKYNYTNTDYCFIARLNILITHTRTLLNKPHLLFKTTPSPIIEPTSKLIENVK